MLPRACPTPPGPRSLLSIPDPPAAAAPPPLLLLPPQTVLRAWLPLSEAVLGMAVRHLPSPPASAPLRMPHLLAATPGQLGQLQAELPPSVARAVALTEAALTASSSDPAAPTVIYISKMVSVPAATLPRYVWFWCLQLPPSHLPLFPHCRLRLNLALPPAHLPMPSKDYPKPWTLPLPPPCLHKTTLNPGPSPSPPVPP